MEVMTDFAIKVDELTKRYQIGRVRRHDRNLTEAIAEFAAEPLRRLRRFGRSSHSDKDAIWALNGVSFNVQPGEVTGLIGRNGAGKTTLLSVLSRITEPTSGRAEIRGRVASLLEVGTGFHPELTGRQNVYLSGAILGMRRRELDACFDEIVAFSGVEKFIDTPIKRYSTGMRVRLGFAVAAHLQAEILLVDEVLAVGDADFRQKCIGKMESVGRQGRTVLLVSHNMQLMQQLCERVLLMEDGKVTADGPARQVVQQYLQTGMRMGGECEWPRPPAGGPEGAWLRSARLINHSGEVCSLIRANESFEVQVEYEIGTDHTLPAACVAFLDGDGNRLFGSSEWEVDARARRPRDAGVYRSRCQVPGDLFAAGEVYLEISLVKPEPAPRVIQQETAALAFEVVNPPDRNELLRPGLLAPRLDWDIQRL